MADQADEEANEHAPAGTNSGGEEVTAEVGIILKRHAGERRDAGDEDGAGRDYDEQCTERIAATGRG
jgi:hypothetical protein